MKDLTRHGDILFRRLTVPIPSENLHTKPGKVIQEGEVTGHAHRITEGDAAILEQYAKSWQGEMQATGSRFLDVQKTATVSHEEHKPVVLAPGLYEILQAREFDYAANLGRRVVD
jgi:Na+-transporting NADH:ubiquinone oxidoreductase subunit NqrA